jgi:hypothetical protein
MARKKLLVQTKEPKRCAPKLVRIWMSGFGSGRLDEADDTTYETTKILRSRPTGVAASVYHHHPEQVDASKISYS